MSVCWRYLNFDELASLAGVACKDEPADFSIDHRPPEMFLDVDKCREDTVVSQIVVRFSYET
jgi:hypothetical protein